MWAAVEPNALKLSWKGGRSGNGGPRWTCQEETNPRKVITTDVAKYMIEQMSDFHFAANGKDMQARHHNVRLTAFTKP